MRRSGPSLIVFGVAVLSASAPPLGAQGALAPQTNEEKIVNALAAGPGATVGDATIWEWPAEWPETFGAPRVLRAGTSAWVCIADDPTWPGNDATCFDEEWAAWYRAYMAGESAPRPARVGIGYMLTIDTHASNTDPYGEAPTPDNQWHHVMPHVMILFPDPADLVGFPADPSGGGPYVMYAETPFAHLMVPIE